MEIYINCILHIKGSASAVCHTAPEGSTFDACKPFMHLYAYNMLLRAQEGVLYVKYSTRGVVERTIQNEANHSAILCVVAELNTFLEMFVNLPF